MKKLFLLLLLIVGENTSFAQWNILDSTHLISSICLLQPNDGWAFGKEFRHWNGTNWTTVVQDSAFGAGSCAFPTPNDGWVFGVQDSVYRYNGSFWTKQFLGFAGNGPCSFYDSNHGWIISLNGVYIYLYGIWYLYFDEIPLYLTTNGCFYSNVVAIDTNSAMIAGFSFFQTPYVDSAYFFNTRTSPWTIDSVIPLIRFNAVSFSDQNHGWALGVESNMLDDKLYKYNGSHWIYQQTFITSTLGAGLYMYSNSLGWLSLGSGVVYNYDGLSWIPEDTLKYAVQQFSFPDPLNGWALIPNSPHPTNHSWLYQTTTGGLGKEEYLNSFSSKIKIFPNPATTTLTIDGLSTKAISEIYDISGKLLLTNQLNTNQIDINGLANGMYFIKLTTKEGSAVRKFVKE
jgi:hypothetical protein